MMMPQKYNAPGTYFEVVQTRVLIWGEAITDALIGWNRKSEVSMNSIPPLTYLVEVIKILGSPT